MRLLYSIFLGAGLFLSSSVSAATYGLPAGCYVSYQYPGYCWQPGAGNYLTWVETVNQSDISNAYGYTMAIIISNGAAAKNDLNTCVDDYNNLVTDYNDLGNGFEATRAALVKQKRLAKKLRAACGTKCDSIR